MLPVNQFPPFQSNSLPKSNRDAGLRRIFNHLGQSLARDQLVQQTTSDLRRLLQIDRVVIYHFYSQWQGRVTFESLGDRRFSIYGSTGPDDCFNQGYAQMYLAGRVNAIADIATAEIEDCHRQFLQGLEVRANLVVPILVKNRLWGLLIAHHCQRPRSWSPEDVQAMQQGARTLAQSSVIHGQLADGE